MVTGDAALAARAFDLRKKFTDIFQIAAILGVHPNYVVAVSQAPTLTTSDATDPTLP